MAKPNIKLNKTKKELTIKELTIKNQEVFNFLEDKKDIELWVERALVIGCIGLKQMVLTDNVDFVEKAFNRFLNDAKESFGSQTNIIDEKLKLFFDLKNSDSMISKFKEFLDEQQDAFDMNNKESLFSKFKEFMESQKEEIGDQFENTFSLDNKKSSFFQFKEQLNQTFDMKHSDSPLNQFKILIEEYFDKKNGILNETMQEYFDDKDGKIKYLLDTAFDIENKNSSFSKLLKEIKDNTDIEEDKIHELLNPNKTDSPMKLLKESLFERFNNLKEEDLRNIQDKIKELKDNEIKEIRDEVLKKNNIEEERSKGTQKGFDFEDLVYETLEEIASFYEDKVFETGTKSSGKGKVGDICIDLDCDVKKRVVIECKDSGSYKRSIKKTKDEILSAISNRNAKFGVFLFAKPEQMPPKLRPIKITDKYIITSFSDQNLYFVYRFIRLLLLRKNEGKEDKIDFEKLSKEFIVIEDKIRNVDNLQAKVTNIINSGEYVRQNLGDLRSGIEISLEKIKAILGNKLNEDIDDDENNIDEELDKDINEDEIIEEDNDCKSSFKKICPICQQEFKSLAKDKKYCSYECKDVLARLKSVKSLTIEEKELKKRLEKEGIL